MQSGFVTKGALKGEHRFRLSIFPSQICGKFVAMLGRNQCKMAVVLSLAGGAIL